MFQKDMTPLTKGGKVKAHRGKGASAAPMPDRNQLKQLTRPGHQSMNDYAKASPMPQPLPPGAGGLGSGGWSGNGM